ncbi:MAG TPA: hypothetical protein VFF59_03280 [Anaerolineae bacterium]|nr:hypothetical protein [Anaerolineae bacterium]
MRSHWITHQGQRIFYADYSNFGTNMDALKTELDAVVATVSQEPPGSVMVLNNVQGTISAPGATAMLRETVTRTNPYVRKRAVIGLGGVRRGLLDIINVFTGRGTIHAFDDEHAALEWLVRDA